MEFIGAPSISADQIACLKVLIEEHIQCIWESIQTPLLFPHFVMLQPYSKMDSVDFVPRQSPHNSP